MKFFKLQIAFSFAKRKVPLYGNLIWIYSIQSLYAVINNRGAKQVFTPIMWKLSVPPRLHIFLWLLANNKTLTRDNLSRIRKVEDSSCLLCNETKSVHHLFFGCCIAKVLWR
jgi:hypothetical protein